MTNADLKVYNTLSRSKEAFEPINPPFVGMYLCGPTVYGEAHLGHARSAVSFDLVLRYLRHLGFKVRYVRNITDVGHLEQDADDGEDKIAKKARLEQLEPMEIAQLYTNSYHQDMDMLNVERPGIEPLASGHIPEQIELIQKIIENGLAYVSNGSVYFDVLKYNENENYGKLSGRILEDLMAGTRDLDGQSEKRNGLDFALWKNASPEHIMRWKSPWGVGFPGWHIECTAMGSKYLGAPFDIHAGGMDLLFPHHECEIAQSKAGHKAEPAKYWLHNNMITINGQKMGKSLGNFITLKQFFTGNHAGLTQKWSPMALRFFILQSHYRSTLDFSEEALLASSKGYRKIINGLALCDKITWNEGSVNQQVEADLEKSIQGCYDAMNDDFNSAMVIAQLFYLLKKINTWYLNPAQTGEVSSAVFSKVLETYQLFTKEILGLSPEPFHADESFIDLILSLYKEAKEAKNYAQVDVIRAKLKGLGIVVKDMKSGIGWAYDE